MSTSNRIYTGQMIVKNNPAFQASPVRSSLLGEMVAALTSRLDQKLVNGPLDTTDVLEVMRRAPMVVVSGEEIKEDLEGAIEQEEEEEQVEENEEALEDAKEEAEETADDKADFVGPQSYIECKSNAVNLIVDLLNRSISTARNEAAPLIKECVNGYSSEYVSYTEQAAGGNAAVLPAALSPIWETATFQEFLDRWDLGSASETQLVIKLPFLNDIWMLDSNGEGSDDLYSFLLTGIAEIDELIPSIVENYGVYPVQTLLGEFFGSDCSGTMNSKLPKEIIGADAIVILLLFLVNLNNNPPENFTGVSTIAQFDTVVLQYLNTLCHTGKRVIRSVERQDKTNQLIIKAPAEDVLRMGFLEESSSSASAANVIVDMVVYERFLAGGGTDQAILGWLLGSRENPEKAYDTILGRTAFYIQRWNTYIELLQSDLADARFYHLRSYLKNRVKEMIDSSDTNAQDSGVTKEQMLSCLNRELDLLKPSTTVNVSLVIQKIVSSVLYGHTAVPKILEYLENAGESKLGENSREFALVGIIDYLCNWANENICIE